MDHIEAALAKAIPAFLSIKQGEGARFRDIISIFSSWHPSIDRETVKTVMRTLETTRLLKPARAVVLRPGKPPIVNGKVMKKVLTPSQQDVVSALLQVGAEGLSLRDLVEKSRRGDARGILNRLAEDPYWDNVIQLPGGPGGIGYRIG